MMRAAAGVLREPGAVESRLQFDGEHRDRADQVIIATRTQGSEKFRQETITQLIQAFDRVGTANSLTRDAERNREGRVQLAYRRAGVLTHSIEIARADATAALRSPGFFPQHRGTPRLAVILDDVGNDRTVAEAIFRLPYPLTVSILPNHIHSTDIAREAHERGYQVMLHLPMQAVANEKPEAQELRAGMSARDVSALVDQFLKVVPDVSGVNNHQGSQSTADTALMEELMPVLRDRKLFYVDSRTTTATVAFDTAQSLGLHSGFRNVPFLDDVAELQAVRKQLQLAFRGAREKGEAIAIGHPHAATLQALREVLPQASSQGIQLVFVSQVVH
jgi:polysaccharide deacetylase 2 family uncharacterized protein YibQ